jgi:superfamily II RNA helicase
MASVSNPNAVPVTQKISQEEYLEQMKRNREQVSNIEKNKITTLTYDFRNGDEVVPVISESYLKCSEDSDSESETDIAQESPEEKTQIDPKDLVYQVKYTYDKFETVKTTPSISKENMINFLNKQGANGGFNPVHAYNNTLSETDKAHIKEETIRKNKGASDITTASKSENERIIEELGARKSSLTKAERKKLEQAEKEEKARKKMEKEVAKALKGPSKKVQEIISKKDTAKEEKVLSDDEKYLEKLKEELRANRIKTVNDSANWIIIISNHEHKMKAFELLFMEITEPILKKIIYVEIIRRTSVDAINSKHFREAMIKFARTFPTNELIKFQLKEMEDIIPPFSPFEKKKMCLDPWQIDVFKYINEKFSILIDAPTAAGKTVCATYCVTVCEKVLFVLPSKELANQVAGVIRSMTTPTTNFTPIKLITGENIYEDANPKVYIGTAVDLERYFNLEGGQRIREDERELMYGSQFNIDIFDYIIVDEIHQMNSPEQGCAMQRLIKRFKCPMLGLSATIGNPEDLKSWIKYLKASTPNREVKRVSYDKRFINQQKHVWNGKELVPIHPLSVITLEDLQTGKLTRTEMQFIPKDLFSLYDQMEKLYPRDAIVSVIPETFFENACIGLNECKRYENVMKSLLTSLSQTYPEQTSQLLGYFLIPDIALETLGPKDLYHVLKEMQHSKKLPAIIFKFDPTTCKKVASDILEWMEVEEQIKYPHYRETRELQSQSYKKMKLQIDAIDQMDFGKSDDVKSDKLE